MKQECRRISFPIDLMGAYESLGKIMGESLGEDLINEIFRQVLCRKIDGGQRNVRKEVGKKIVTLLLWGQGTQAVKQPWQRQDLDLRQ